MSGCLGVFFAVIILCDAFDHPVWHGREWAEFILGVGVLLIGVVMSFFDDYSIDYSSSQDEEDEFDEQGR